MRSMLSVGAVLACCAVAQSANPVEEKCLEWIDAVTVMAVGSKIDLSSLRSMADEETFRWYTLPFSLGTPTEGYTFDEYKARLEPVYELDPFLEYNFTSTKLYTSSVGCGADIKYGCFIHGNSSGLTESGRDYGQNYMLTIEMNGDLEVITHYEYTDALYSACFFGVLPTAVCKAIGQ